MNILTDALPKCVRVGGNVFEIETDFRAGVSFAIMIEAGEENLVELCKPFFPDGIPRDITGAVEAIIFFFRGGEKEEKETSKKATKPVYSFDVDKEAIYSDFWHYYNVDLANEGLHWWSFRSLLMGLPEESNFKKRIYYRTCNLRDLPKKEQKRIAEIRKEIEIKTKETAKKTLEERNTNMKEYIVKRQKELAKGGE